MMSIGKTRVKNFMTLEYEFTGVRIVEQSLIPVDWTLKVNLVASIDPKSQLTDETDANLVYRKIYFWLETNLPNVVIVNVKDEDDLYIANLSSNIMMYCPGKATDDLIIQLLHAKISELADSSLFIGEMELKGSDTTLRYTFDCPDGDYKLPEKTEDYYNIGKLRDENPWWFRDDGFCFEIVAAEDNTEENPFADIVDPMDEFHNYMKDIEEISVVREPARIIQIEKWQPKKL